MHIFKYSLEELHFIGTKRMLHAIQDKKFKLYSIN